MIEKKKKFKSYKKCPVKIISGEHLPKIKFSEDMLSRKKRYWYAINLSKEERKHIRKCIKKDPELNGRVILKAVKRRTRP